MVRKACEPKEESDEERGSRKEGWWNGKEKGEVVEGDKGEESGLLGWSGGG